MAATALKVSQYSHVLTYPDGLRLAYNALTGSVMALAGEEGVRVEALLTRDVDAEADPESRATLERLGFLVDRDVDELNVVRELFRRGRRRSGAALLTILPTLGCNFGCPYCFERHIKGLMDAAVQDALVRFVEQRLLADGTRLAIDWFGGEPLLGLSVMESLSARLAEACARTGARMQPASVTTNGYLFTRDVIARLQAAGVTSAQVTLDGPPAVHDRRRPLAGGRGSFERILANVKAAPGDFTVNIRANVDAGNKDTIFELLMLLHAEGVLPKARMYVARVESFSEECRSSQGTFLSSPDFVLFKRQLRARCLEAGIPWEGDEPPRLVTCGFCIVDQPKGFVIQPDGALLKCWAEAGNSRAAPVGHLLDEKTWRHLAASELQRRDPFDDAECRACGVLPVCMGGCPRMRENLRQHGIKRCPPIRYSLADQVRVLYAGNRNVGDLTLLQRV